MIEYEVGGLPLHILVIHAVVVFVPLTALAVVLHAVWPAAGRRLGIVTPLAGLALVVLVPLAVFSGEWLEGLVGSTPAVEQHEALGRTLLPWVIGLLVVGLGEWLWFGREIGRDLPPPRRELIRWVIVAAAIVVAVGSVYTVVLIGDSGARAVWGGIVPAD